MKLTKNRYLQGFSVVVLALAILRLVYPQVAEGRSEQKNNVENTVQDAADTAIQTEENVASKTENVVGKTENVAGKTENVAGKTEEMTFVPHVPQRDASGKAHRIFSVPSYDKAFPDSNALQLSAALRWGVKPVKDRADAEKRKKELEKYG